MKKITIIVALIAVLTGIFSACLQAESLLSGELVLQEIHGGLYKADEYPGNPLDCRIQLEDEGEEMILTDGSALVFIKRVPGYGTAKSVVLCRQGFKVVATQLQD